ncbi:hypothetical protein DFH08DRAFT_931886 [Mycena albidolilacea]|uniref:Uncharacterized protein n=1 Tax=Mycena albidolilacea TaxID=1033008 RepID=A0AAD7AHU5_9AGAR|nr:hypothetical protein DFH08DRAFT_931886 [Mycena albidolilacea]
MTGELESGTQRIVVDGEIITLPNLSVAEFCRQYRLSDEIHRLLETEKFETAGAVLEAAETNLEKAGFKQGQIAELKRGLREFVSTKMSQSKHNPEQALRILAAAKRSFKNASRTLSGSVRRFLGRDTGLRHEVPEGMDWNGSTSEKS